jgi:hypothetical protein
MSWLSGHRRPSPRYRAFTATRYAASSARLTTALTGEWA